MDAKLKQKWVKALRSGEFKQGKGKLFDRESGKYCCLGVLCSVAGVPFEEANVNYRDVFQGRFGMKRYGDLWFMNDIEHRPFPEIADYIEKNL